MSVINLTLCRSYNRERLSVPDLNMERSHKSESLCEKLAESKRTQYPIACFSRETEFQLISDLSLHGMGVLFSQPETEKLFLDYLRELERDWDNLNHRNGNSILFRQK